MARIGARQSSICTAHSKGWDTLSTTSPSEARATTLMAFSPLPARIRFCAISISLTLTLHLLPRIAPQERLWPASKALFLMRLPPVQSREELLSVDLLELLAERASSIPAPP